MTAIVHSGTDRAKRLESERLMRRRGSQNDAAGVNERGSSSHVKAISLFLVGRIAAICEAVPREQCSRKAQPCGKHNRMSRVIEV